MRFAVLGPVAVWDGGGEAGVGGPQQRVVLAALVAQRGRTVPGDLLVEALWGGEPPRSAEHTLRTVVSRLRRVLGDVVVTRDGGYLLDVPAADVDAGRFDELRAAGDVTALREALGLWRGPAYAGLADLAPVRGEARRLEEARSGAREALAAALAAAGRAGEAAAEAEALVADEPYREGAWAVLVDALSLSGRPADGLAAYRRAAAALDELGLEPTAPLREAQRRALLAHEAVPAVAPDVPVPASSLVGRDDDLAAVAALLETARLVTLVGPGGVGKTRLALSAARDRERRHEAGGRVVELAALTDPAAVPAAVAAGLGLAVDAGPPEAALARAAALDAVVLLDNCEHVIDTVAAVVETMAARPGPLRILATSRERLGVPGEHVHLVEPLPPGEAADLFRERAAAASGLAGPGDDDAVARLVRRLDGLPLAIEMAAARTSTTGAAELADRLDERIAGLRDPAAGATRGTARSVPSSPGRRRCWTPTSGRRWRRGRCSPAPYRQPTPPPSPARAWRRWSRWPAARCSRPAPEPAARGSGCCTPCARRSGTGQVRSARPRCAAGTPSTSRTLRRTRMPSCGRRGRRRP